MKKFIPLSLCTALGGMAMAAENDLAKRVEALEYQSYENSLTWSGFLETRYDQVTLKPAGGGAKTKMNLNRNLAAIDFKSKPLPNVSVFGRFAYSSVFNNLSPAVGTLSTMGRPYEDNTVRVERMFLNYGVINGLTLSIGRLPTLDGPPNNLWDGLSRQGSYLRQVYSTSLDGYALTYDIPLGSDTHRLSARVIYNPTSNITVNNSGTGADVFSPSEIYDSNPVTQTVTASGKMHASSTPVASWMLDYSWDNPGFAQSITAIYQGYKIHKLTMSSALNFEYMNNTGYLEIKDIASTGLTVYESYGKTKVKTNGPVSIGSSKPNATVEGTISTTGVIYTIPVNAMNNPLLGYEMFSGDKGSLQFDNTNRDPFGFFVQRGKGSHIFYTQPLNAHIKLRVGMMDSKPEYKPGIQFLDPTKATMDQMTSVYANLRTDF